MSELSRSRKFEIGVALLLTLAALVFVSLTVWAADKPSIQVTDAWARPTIGQSKTSAAYMRIANEGGEDDTLAAVRSPKVRAVELHQTTMTADGVMQMRKLEDGVSVPAGGSLVMDPGGMHLMLLGVEDALNEGDELTLTLEFAGAGTIDVRVPVVARGPGAARAH